MPRNTGRSLNLGLVLVWHMLFNSAPTRYDYNNGMRKHSSALHTWIEGRGRPAFQFQAVLYLILPCLLATMVCAAEQSNPYDYPPHVDQTAMDALTRAIDQDDPVKIAALLTAKPILINQPTNSAYFIPPLAYALHNQRQRSIATITCLLDHGADIHFQNLNSPPPLTSALGYTVAHGRAKLVRLLLDRGADVNAPGSEFPPLNAAIAAQDVECVNLLLARGANVNEQPGAEPQPLLFALLNGSVDIVHTLIDHGADLKVTDRLGRTALHYAARSDKPRELFELLLPAGLDPNAADNYGATVLMYYMAGTTLGTTQGTLRQALFSNRPRSDLDDLKPGFQFLIDHGADLKSVDANGCTVLYYAAAGADAEMIQRCLNAGLDVNAPDHSGDTPLDRAMAYQNMATMPLLLKHGAQFGGRWSKEPGLLARFCYGTDQHLRFRFPMTLVEFVRRRNEVLDTLIARGFSLNAPTQAGETPLVVACQSHDIEALRWLLDHGADPNFGTDGRRALDWAVGARGYWDITKLLLDHGANPNLGAGGSRPLDLAVNDWYRSEQSLQLTQLLLDRGANAWAPDLAGGTALSRLLSPIQADSKNSVSQRLDVQTGRYKVEAQFVSVIYAEQWFMINCCLLIGMTFITFGLSFYLRRRMRRRLTGGIGSHAEAVLDHASTRKDWQDLLPRLEAAQTLHRRAIHNRSWIAIGLFAWVFLVALYYLDPILRLLVSPSSWVYASIASAAIFISFGFLFVRPPMLRIFSAALGLIVLVVGGTFAGAGACVVTFYPHLYLLGTLLTVAILILFTAAWRYYVVIEIEVRLRRVKLPPWIEFNAALPPEGIELDTPAGWDQSR